MSTEDSNQSDCESQSDVTYEPPLLTPLGNVRNILAQNIGRYMDANLEADGQATA